MLIQINNKKKKLGSLKFFFFSYLIFLFPLGTKADSTWQNLEKGLDYAEFESPQKADNGDSIIRVLRISMQYYNLQLLNAAAEKKGKVKTAKQWSQNYQLVAAINASMYQTDNRTSVSYMKNEDYVNNAYVSKDKTVLAFNPLSNKPAVKLIDRQCDDFHEWKKHYKTLVQNIRMISCTGENVWKPKNNKSSIAAIGVDHDDNVYFIHIRSQYSTYDAINHIKSLPIKLSGLMYVEGGPEAQLYINAGEIEREFYGSLSSKFTVNNFFSWPIPNVIGVLPK